MIVAAVGNTLETAPDFFVINMTTANPINQNQILIQYRGKSGPPLTCNMSVYDYSLDNIVWHPMTITEDSAIANLNFTVRWRNFSITWNALTDLEDKVPDPSNGFYNINIWIRFRAMSGTLETSLISYRVFYKNPVVQIILNPSNDHIDINGHTLLEQAPGIF